MTSIGGQASRASIDPQSRTNNLNGLEADNQRLAPANSENAPEQAPPRLSRDEGSVLTVSDEARALANAASEQADSAEEGSAQAASTGRDEAARAERQSARQEREDNAVSRSEGINQQAVDTFAQVASFGQDDNSVSFSAIA